MKIRNKHNFIFNKIMSWSGYSIEKHILSIEEFNKKNMENSMAWLNDKKWEILKFHYSNNHFYKDKIGNLLPGKWGDVPILTKPELQLGIKKVITKKISKNDIYISSTSGSSGQPLLFAKDKNSHSRAWAFWIKRYREMGLSMSSKEARFYGIPKNFKGYIIEKIKDFILNRVRFTVFDLSEKNLSKYFKKFTKIKFDYIYGYTNSILIFSKYLQKKGIVLKDVCKSLKIVVLTSEVCTNEDRLVIEKYIGVPVKNEYGASEVGYIAYECNSKSWHVCKENIFIEHDSSGRLLVTDLFNKAFPIIRYEIGDLGKVENKVCKCGKEDLIITNFDGRKNDTVFLPNGDISPGFTFYYISREILESEYPIKEFIVRQTLINKLIFEVVMDIEISDNIVKYLQNLVDEYVGKGLKIKVEKVKSIDRTESGKIKHFYSEIN